MSEAPSPPLLQAASLVQHADALLVGAGAGMSADSGIAVYRGHNGRYSSPDVLKQANADTFSIAPREAAEATRQRYLDVLAAVPHEGYRILDTWRQHLPYGAFVYTSNIDSMFTRAAFPAENVYEVHGALSRSQCLNGCAGVFATTPPADGPAVCQHCDRLARPNVMLFGDYAFNDHHREGQWEHFSHWSDALPEEANVVILEIGAGIDVATVRNKCESLSAGCGWPLIRINPHEPDLPAHAAPGSISLPMTALTALQQLASHALTP